MKLNSAASSHENHKTNADMRTVSDAHHITQSINPHERNNYRPNNF